MMVVRAGCIGLGQTELGQLENHKNLEKEELLLGLERNRSLEQEQKEIHKNPVKVELLLGQGRNRSLELEQKEIHKNLVMKVHYKLEQMQLEMSKNLVLVQLVIHMSLWKDQMVDYKIVKEKTVGMMEMEQKVDCKIE